MNTRLTGFLVVIAAVFIGVYYFRKRATTTPLAKHWKELEDRASIGSVSNAVAYMSQPPNAMMGEGTFTATQMNIANPNPVYNRPMKVRVGVRYPQPR